MPLNEQISAGLPPGIPPEIAGKVKHVLSGTSTSFSDNTKDTEKHEDPIPWIPYSKVKFYTNAFIVKNGKILLGYKKRGLGVNKYNGFGGKVELNETSLEAACRELEEESGVSASLIHAGVLLFVSEDTEAAFHIDIYRGDGYENIEKDVKESDEMRPEWFEIDKIPFEKMWEDDVYWMPMLLEKKRFWGRADFRFVPGDAGKEGKQARWWFGEMTLES